MFIDEKTITLTAGRGGDGAMLFRHEKYVPRGGADGGDGGNGGDIVVVADTNLHALNHLAHLDRLQAEDGKVGGHQKSSGKSGLDLELHLPPGTQIINIEDNSLLLELVEPEQRAILAKGGNGGWGNFHFKSSINQTPERFNEGKPGQSFKVKLVLKLIADVGLVGLPNAGKSTLLSVLTSAVPKIADYPFTTLEPQLGVTKYQKDQLSPIVIADLPGLIKGASQGKGLGDQFLRHLERTKVIVHCLDVSVDSKSLITHYKTIRAELTAWSKVFSNKPEIIALTKTETVSEKTVSQITLKLKKITSAEIVPISALARQGLNELLQTIDRLIRS